MAHLFFLAIGISVINLSFLTTLLTMNAASLVRSPKCHFEFLKLRCHALPKILQDNGCKGKGKCWTAGVAPGAEGARPSAKAKAKGSGKTAVAAKPAAKPKPKAKGVAKASCKQKAKSRA